MFVAYFWIFMKTSLVIEFVLFHIFTFNGFCKCVASFVKVVGLIPRRTHKNGQISEIGSTHPRTALCHM